MSTSDCTQDMKEAGMSYPRTCPTCGLGPCVRPKAKVTRTGTPLQAMKFALEHVQGATIAFLHNWLYGDAALNRAFAFKEDEFKRFCEANPDEPARSDGRKTHYGDGRQPLDDIVDAGWGPGFVCGNILKYLRRTKTPERDLEAARWYWKYLTHMAITLGDFARAQETLRTLLTEDEIARLEAA